MSVYIVKSDDYDDYTIYGVYFNDYDALQKVWELREEYPHCNYTYSEYEVQ